MPDRTWYLDSSLEPLANPAIRHACLSQPNQALARRYPLRLLRYWFMYQLLTEEWLRKGPLSVGEFGVDRGQMLSFARTAAAASDGPPHGWLAAWDAVDVKLQTQQLAEAGYSRLVQLDIEHDAIPADLEGRHDVIILLHVLEHLREPEQALERILPCLKPGGIVIGGMPVLPDALMGWQQRRLRRKARLHGHVSAFSPQRVRSWVGQFGLTEEMCAGAFFLRSKRLALEDSPAWVRFNLYFGFLCPWWPGELYWSFRKPL